MDLVVKIKKGLFTKKVRFENKEFFITRITEAYNRKIKFGCLIDADKVIYAFVSGVTISGKDFSKLCRALRRYDEVYLCNELFDLFESTECDMATIGDKFGEPFDMSGYDV